MEKQDNLLVLAKLCQRLMTSFMLRCSNVEGFGLEAEARMTTWHVMMPSENEADTQQSQDVSEGTTVSDGH